MKKWILLSALLLVVVGQLQAGEKERGYLGVTLATVTNVGDGEEYDGVYIDEVLPDTGAEAAGLAAKDRIVAMDGAAVRNMKDIYRVLHETGPDSTVAVTVDRDGVEQDIMVILGRPPAKHEARWGVVVDRKGPFLGVHVQKLTPQLADHFGVDGGLLVSEVLEDTPAASAGIKAGDVLLEIGDTPLRDSGQIHKALAKSEVGQEVAVRLQRDGGPMTLYVEVQEMDAKSMQMFLEQMHHHGDHDEDIEVVVPIDELERHHGEMHKHHHQVEEDSDE
jgi:serine protease Do